MNDRLLYRRQFFLGADFLEAFPTWNRRQIAGRHRISAHPDLPMTHVEQGRRSITLLGFVLDPDDPSADDAKIIDRLCRELDKSSDFPGLTSRLGGRWVMVVHDGDETVLFHDAAGLRQVYYLRASEPQGARLVCASQPGLLAELHGLTPDPAALDYVKSRGDSDWEVYWLPGDTSPYQEVKALLPNHLLRIEERAVARYWPTTDVKPISYEKGLRDSVRLLRGLVDSARRRHKLAVAMTAGWDSRLMLALSKEEAPDLYCYTLLYPSTSRRSRDVYVPAKLLAKLGIEHHLLRYPEVADTSFKEVAKRSSSSVHTAYCLDTQALRDDYPPERLCVTGDVAEVVKVHYRIVGRAQRRPTPAELAAVAKIGAHPFALAAFESWLSGVPQQEHIDLLDLFCWEQMAGRWHGQIRAEYDIVQESFAPLDCRALLLTMLAVDERYRTGPKFRLFRDMLAALWKDVLQVPINPREKIRWKRTIATALQRLHIYDLIPPRAKQLAKRISRKLG